MSCCSLSSKKIYHYSKLTCQLLVLRCYFYQQPLVARNKKSKPDWRLQIFRKVIGNIKARSKITLLMILHMLYLSFFVSCSRYRNLIEKALRARLVYNSPHMNRSVSFEYMNRQLVWNEFSVRLSSSVCPLTHDAIIILKVLGTL